MYETGLAAAFLAWLWSAIWLLVMINSQFDRNLRRVGMRLSWATLKPKQMTPKDHSRTWIGATGRYCLVLIAGLPFVLLSWAYVAWMAGQFFHRLHKDRGRPAAAREFEWKLKNLDLSFDQISKEMHTMNTALGMEQRGYEEFRDELQAVVTSP